MFTINITFRYSTYKCTYTHTLYIIWTYKTFWERKTLFCAASSWRIDPQTYEAMCCVRGKNLNQLGEEAFHNGKSIFSGANGLWAERKVNLLSVIILSRDSKWLLEYCCMGFSLKMGPIANIRSSRMIAIPSLVQFYTSNFRKVFVRSWISLMVIKVHVSVHAE